MKPNFFPKAIIIGILFWANLALSQDGLIYANPSEVGLDSVYIYKKVDSLMTLGIKNEAFPANLDFGGQG